MASKAAREFTVPASMGLACCCTDWKALLPLPGCIKRFMEFGDGAAMTGAPPKPAEGTACKRRQGNAQACLVAFEPHDAKLIDHAKQCQCAMYNPSLAKATCVVATSVLYSCSLKLPDQNPTDQLWMHSSCKVMLRILAKPVTNESDRLCHFQHSFCSSKECTLVELSTAQAIHTKALARPL